MPDLAHLHITVSSDEATKAAVNLDDMGVSAKQTETSVTSLGRVSQAQFSLISQGAEQAAAKVATLGQSYRFIRSESGLLVPEGTKLAATTKAVGQALGATRTHADNTGKSLGHMAESMGLGHRSIHKLTSVLLVAQGAAAGAERDFVHLGGSFLTAALFGNKFTVALTAVAAVIGFLVGSNKEAEDQAKKSQEAFREQMTTYREKAEEAREALRLLADAEKGRGTGRDPGAVTAERKRKKELTDLEEQVVYLEEARQLNLKIAGDLRLATQRTHQPTYSAWTSSTDRVNPTLEDVRKTQSAARGSASRQGEELEAINRRILLLKQEEEGTDEAENKLLSQRALLHLSEVAAIHSARDATIAGLKATEEGRNAQLASSAEEITGLEHKRSTLAHILKIFGGQDVEMRRQIEILDEQIARSKILLRLNTGIDDKDRDRARRTFNVGTAQTDAEAKSIEKIAAARKKIVDATGNRRATIAAQQEDTLLQARLTKEAALVALEEKFALLRDKSKRPQGVTDEDVTKQEAAERARIAARFKSDQAGAINAATIAEKDYVRALFEESLALDKVAQTRDQTLAELRATEKGQNARLVGLKFEIGALDMERITLIALGKTTGGLTDAQQHRLNLLVAEIEKQRAILGLLTQIDSKEKERLQREFDRNVQATKLDTTANRSVSQARLTLEAAKAVTFGNPKRLAGMEREVTVLEAEIARSKALFDLETQLIDLRDPKKHPELDATRVAAFEAAKRAQIEGTYASSLGSAFERERLAELDRVTTFVRDVGEMITHSLSDAVVDGIYNGFKNIDQIALQLSQTFMHKVVDTWLQKGLDSVLTSTFSGSGGGISGLLGGLGNALGGQGAQFQAAAAAAGATFTASTSVATTTFVTGVAAASSAMIAAAAQAAALLASGGAAGGGGGLLKTAAGLVPTLLSAPGGSSPVSLPYAPSLPIGGGGGCGPGG